MGKAKSENCTQKLKFRSQTPLEGAVNFARHNPFMHFKMHRKAKWVINKIEKTDENENTKVKMWGWVD